MVVNLNVFSIYISSKTLRQQSPKVIVFCFFQFDFYTLLCIKQEYKNKSSDFPSYFGLIKVENSQKCFASVGLVDREQ